jgi:hypothetical protein
MDAISQTSPPLTPLPLPLDKRHTPLLTSPGLPLTPNTPLSSAPRSAAS